MSKDLEKEYRALVDSEVPDLWTRIEAELDEKPVHSYHENLMGKKRKYKMWAGIAAACACVVVSISVIVRYFPASNDNFYRVSPNNNTVSMECAPEAAEYGAAELADETVLEEGVFPAAMNEEYDSVGKDSNAAVSGGVGNNSVNMEAAGQGSSNFIVTAEVVDIDVRMDSGILYTVKVTVSENATVQAGSEIKIFCSALSAEGVISLEKSQSYQLTLANDMPHNEKEVIYTLQAAENE